MDGPIPREQPVSEACLARIEAWLAGRVAFYLDYPAGGVDPEDHLLELGLDSISAIGLCGDVEEGFGVAVEPATLWEEPTVRAFARSLLREVSRITGVAAPEEAVP